MEKYKEIWEKIKNCSRKIVLIPFGSLNSQVCIRITVWQCSVRHWRQTFFDANSTSGNNSRGCEVRTKWKLRIGQQQATCCTFSPKNEFGSMRRIWFNAERFGMKTKHIWSAKFIARELPFANCDTFSHSQFRSWFAARKWQFDAYEFRQQMLLRNYRYSFVLQYLFMRFSVQAHVAACQWQRNDRMIFIDFDFLYNWMDC